MLAAVALGAAVSAQAAAYNGDLIIGFTAGSGNDFEFDLGQQSSLTGGQTFDLHTQLSGFNLSTVNWGVVGTQLVGANHFSWSTANSTPLAGLAAWSKVNTAVGTIYGLGFAGTGPGDSSSPSSADPASWNQEMLQGTISTQYRNVYVNPNTVGTGTANFLAVTAGASGTTSTIGTFTLDNTGMLTFTAVPEPSTYGVLAGMGLLALCLRRQFVNKAA
jgi:hypothetical protein